LVSGLIDAVVLAAGQSKRMGKPKQTLPIGGKAMLGRVIEAFRGSKVDGIIVVLGAQGSQVRRDVEFQDEVIVVNRRYKEGMSGSLRLGLGAVSDLADAVIIALGDQPFLRSETIDAMVDEYVATRAPVVVPVYHGQRGNPVLFDRSLFAQVARIEGDRGAKSVVRGNEARVREVPVEDEGVLFDIDTPADFKAAGAVARRRRRILGGAGPSRGPRRRVA
jgi:molybdenum cofactor cytidylyltransferase